GGDWPEDDIASAGRSGVQLVTSALTEIENEELSLIEEPRCCTKAGIDFLPFPIQDRSLPLLSKPLIGYWLRFSQGSGKVSASRSIAARGLDDLLYYVHRCWLRTDGRTATPFRRFSRPAGSRCRIHRSSGSGSHHTLVGSTKSELWYNL